MPNKGAKAIVRRAATIWFIYHRSLYSYMNVYYDIDKSDEIMLSRQTAAV